MDSSVRRAQERTGAWNAFSPAKRFDPPGDEGRSIVLQTLGQIKSDNEKALFARGFACLPADFLKSSCFAVQRRMRFF
jgi:hypothetical protein